MRLSPDLFNKGKLYRSAITGEQLWDMHLHFLQTSNDPIFRDPASSTHNCNLCKNFIRRYGNVVSLQFDTNTPSISTLFDAVGEPFNLIAAKLKTTPVARVFLETYDELNSLPYEKIKKTGCR